MKLGIIGKPQSGKTTIFNAASSKQEAVGDFSQAVHRAVIKVPDDRLDKLAELVKPKKITKAEIEFLDAAGFTGSGDAASGIEATSELRLMDAFIVIVDAFSGDCNPNRDIQAIFDEMILIDQAMIESNLEKRERKIKLTGDKSGEREMDLLKRALKLLEEEKPLFELDLTEDEEKTLRGYQFLSQKPSLIVLNINEDKINSVDELLLQNKDLVTDGQRELTAMCGKIEMELVSLEEDERVAFLDDLGIKTPAVELVIQKSYALLGLISFLTAGEQEVRAWTIKKGTIAQKAAGVIHSDIERGFIRAEVINYSDYIELKSEAAVKAAGKMRLEGKTYTVKDGDVILFRFNV